MIDGVHFLLYSRDPEADRRFIADVLAFRSVDVGHGWLIFALPPAEIAVHPASQNLVQRHADHDVAGAVVYLMCRDIHAAIAALNRKGVAATDIQQEDWGMRTTIRLPSGSELGLYQPTHRTALSSWGSP
jgi:hypothetical protein